MDSPPCDEVARPFLIDADAPARPVAPWAGAAGVHLVAGLALVGIGLGSPQPSPSPPIEVMTVTLVEPPPPDASPPPVETPAPAEQAGALQAAGRTEFAVDVAPSTLPFALPDYLRLEDPAAAIGAPSDLVRLALAQSLRCRSALEVESAECPPASDYVALADAGGLSPARFLDAELTPLPDGTIAFEVGPVAVSMTMYGPGATPYVVTIKPRGPRAKD